MKTKTLKQLAIAACALALTGSAFAIPITGEISFVGSVGFNGPTIDTSTQIISYTGFGNAGVLAITYADGALTPLSFFSPPINTVKYAAFATPWNFASGGAVPALWSSGGFTFDLSSSIVSFQDDTGLVIAGTGFLKGNSYDPTAYAFSFSVDNSGGTRFAASATNSPRVPDGGSTVALLGIAFLAVFVVQRSLGRKVA